MIFSPAINAEQVASKLQGLQSGRGGFFARAIQDTPRLVEMILFVQWQSIQPAGLRGFAENLIQSSPQWIGTAAMLKTPPTNGAWTLDEIIPLWRDIPWKMVDSEFVTWRTKSVLYSVEASELKKYHAPQLREGLRAFNYSFLHAACVRAARDGLADWLRSLCTRDEVNTAPEYFAGMFPALVAAMDRQTASAEKQIGQTEVKEKVFERLAFALEKDFPVMILGDARIGKTAAESTWCNMKPGLARLVTMPGDNTFWAFIAALADALGIPYDTSTKIRTLQRAIEFTVAHAKLFLVFDEFHYALPVRYSKKSVPHRLNWIRANIVDKGLGCAFFATRQTYNATMDKFVTDTKYQMEQWIGRVAAPLILTPVLASSDLLNMAAAKYPGVDVDFLQLVVGWSMKLEESEAKPSDKQRPVASAAQRHLMPVVAYAQYVAEKAGDELGLEHAETAWREITGKPVPSLAGASVAPTPRVGEPVAKRTRKPRAPRQTQPGNIEPLPVERGNDLAPVGTALAAG